MSRKHSRTFNPVKRHKAHKAQQRQAVVIGAAIEATTLVTSAIVIKKALKDRRNKKLAKASSHVIINEIDHVGYAVMDLEKANYFHSRQPRFSHSRLTSAKLVRAAKKNLKAERELFMAKQVASGSGNILIGATNKHEEVDNKRTEAKLLKIQKKFRGKGVRKVDTTSTEPNLTAVND